MSKVKGATDLSGLFWVAGHREGVRGRFGIIFAIKGGIPPLSLCYCEASCSRGSSTSRMVKDKRLGAAAIMEKASRSYHAVYTLRVAVFPVVVN